ncbi:polysaccharide biosynthesis protein [Sedimentibacter sp. zth1]|uniref:putative polysaccharide biosynthesis protein n=1 Tax=Sedimentibacter sp. zth1 TaxID=2816908 RepID=UPI001A930F51|nr:polysaccharide biosynthesis protein [Sedimentibacter sp. zth1]QSX05157.1 polysaccharide biosynthesis protein [Sedimentibacter sp. zth1]
MKNNIITGTIILTIATVFIRLMGFIFRIYLANTIGAEGIGLYQLILSFYILTITLATSGISIAVSRITAEEIAKNKLQNVSKTLKVSIIICLISSGISTLILLFGAKTVSIYVIKDIRAIYPLIYLAPSLPFLAFSSCFRGYFFATKNVSKPSSAQFLEQIIRIFVTISLLKNIDTSDIAKACSTATIGMTVGEIISFFYIYFLYLFDKKYKAKSKNCDKLLGRILTISIPVAGTSYLNSVLRLLENALIPIKLIQYGMTYSSAISIYGILKGMVLPVLFFPTSFLTSLATMLLPSISSANAKKNNAHITKTVSKVLHFTLTIGLFLVGIFVVFSFQIGNILYHNNKVGLLLKTLSFICPFMYTNMISITILNALGHQLSSFKINILESIIKITVILLFMPTYGFNAYLFVLLFTTVLNTILYLYKLLKVSYIIFDISNWIIKPTMSALISGIISKIIYTSLLNFIFSPVVALLLSIFCLFITYFAFLIAFKSISIQDINLFLSSLKRNKQN